MTRLSIAASCLTIVLEAAWLPARQVRDVRHELTGSGSISGSVVADGPDGRSLARATLSLAGAPLMTARQTVADDAGQFVFTDLPEGQYTLTARKLNFSLGAYGARRPGGTGTPILLKDGQHVTDLRIALAKWGSISGTVYDPSGEPVQGMSVEGLKYTMRTGRRTLTSVYGRPASTDDRGVYAIYGLDAGEYYVAAGPSPDFGLTDLVQLSTSDVDRALLTAASGALPTAVGRERPSRVAFAPVFFSGTTDLANATMLLLKQGEDRTGVDIHLQLVPAARLDITVTNPGGQAVAGTQVVATVLTQANSMVLFSPTAAGAARTEGVGHFTYGSLAPGRYLITARAPAVPATAILPASPPLWAQTEVVISGVDQAATLTLAPGVSVNGRVVFNGTTVRPPTGAANVRIGLTPFAGGVSVGITSVSPASDGTFSLTGVPPGQYLATASVPAAPPGWTLRSAMINDVDALDAPFEIGPNQSVDGLVITYTDRPTELSGSLQATNGTPAPDFTIVVFPTDQHFWTPLSRRSVSTRPATTDRYLIRNLPPGDYYVAAVTDIEPGDWYDPAFLARLVPASTKVTMAEGEKRTFDLRITGG